MAFLLSLAFPPRSFPHSPASSSSSQALDETSKTSPPHEVQKELLPLLQPHHINFPEAREHQRLEQLAADSPGADAEHPRGGDARGELCRATGSGAAHASFERRAPEGVGLGGGGGGTIFWRDCMLSFSFFLTSRGRSIERVIFLSFFFIFLSLSLTTFLSLRFALSFFASRALRDNPPPTRAPPLLTLSIAG